MACIYTTPEGLCSGQFPLSDNEHYLPRGLGNFRGFEPLAGKICTDCNRRFGRLEDVFLHASPEAFFRQMIGQIGRKHHRKKNIFYEPTFGFLGPTILGKQPGAEHEVLWELMPGSDDQCRQMRQLVFRDENRAYHQVPLRPEIQTRDQLQEILEERKLRNATLVDFISDNGDDAKWVAELCKEYLEGRTYQLKEALNEGEVVEAQMTAMISVPYLQAIAKIGFHFLLKHFPVFAGTESQFEGIKRFIYGGGDPNPHVFPTNEQFIRAFARGGLLKTWGHFLTAQYNYTDVQARLQFFAGPRVLPLVWAIRLGQSPLRVRHEAQKGLAFLYFNEEKDGFHGEIVELTPHSKIFTPPMRAAFAR